MEKLSKEFLKDLSNDLNIDAFSLKKSFDEENNGHNFIEDILHDYKIPDKTLIKYIDKLSLSLVLRTQVFSIDSLKNVIIPKLIDKTKTFPTLFPVIAELPVAQGLNEELIIYIYDNFIKLSKNIEKGTLEKNKTYLWKNIGKSIKLSKEFIEEYYLKQKLLRTSEVIKYQNYFTKDELLKYFSNKHFEKEEEFDNLRYLLYSKFWKPEKSFLLHLYKIAVEKSIISSNILIKNNSINNIPPKRKYFDPLDEKWWTNDKKELIEIYEDFLNFLGKNSPLSNDLTTSFIFLKKNYSVVDPINGISKGILFLGKDKFTYVLGTEYNDIPTYSIKEANRIMESPFKDIISDNYCYKIYIPIEAINWNIMRNSANISINKFKIIRKLENVWKL